MIKEGSFTYNIPSIELKHTIPNNKMKWETWETRWKNKSTQRITL